MKQALNRVIDFTELKGEAVSDYDLTSLLALKKLGKTDKLKAALENLAQSSDKDHRLALALLEGQSIDKNLEGDSMIKMLRRLVRY